MTDADLSMLVRAWFDDVPDYIAPRPKLCPEGHEFSGLRCRECQAIYNKRRDRRKEQQP